MILHPDMTFVLGKFDPLAQNLRTAVIVKVHNPSSTLTTKQRPEKMRKKANLSDKSPSKFGHGCTKAHAIFLHQYLAWDEQSVALPVSWPSVAGKIHLKCFRFWVGVCPQQ